jgi:localization factor PodJL
VADGPEKLLTAKSKEGPGLFTAAEQPHTTTAAKTEPGEDLQMLTTAASRGDRDAQFRIGARFLSDGSAQGDPATAARWLTRAADQGHTESQFVLASLYERGAGVTKDEALARELYRKAASAGHPRAMHNLGVLLSAQDTVQDYQEAASWFRSAAAAGLTDSQFNLALLYERGLGVQQNVREAYFWYQVASLAGDKEAALHAERLKRQLPDAESQAASEKAGSWRPTVERLTPRLSADRG